MTNGWVASAGFRQWPKLHLLITVVCCLSFHLLKEHVAGAE
jgi:hypothetical protein